MRALLALAFALWAGAATAETLRIATFNVSLNRSGPGLLVKDLMQDPPPEEIGKIAAIIQEVRPDILLVNELDFDAGNEALTLFADLLREGESGLDYAHLFTAPSNTGIPSGVDLNGDGEATGPADAFGFGRFPGQYGMALLSRFPVDESASATFQTLLWKDLPGAEMPTYRSGAPFPSAEAQGVMRLSSKSHWDIAVDTPGGRLRLFAFHPTPPVFDGPEDANGRRNHDEIRFWQLYIGGIPLPSDQGPKEYDGAPFVLLGDLNADPFDGDARRGALSALLAHPAIQDPAPVSSGGTAASASQGGANARHAGDPANDTADWNDTRGPGNLRVDYVLPSAALRIEQSGVFWPAPGEVGADLVSASDHRLVWVDISLPLR